MIIQSLSELYERLSRDHDYDLPLPGYSIQKITFCIVIASASSMDLQDARQTVFETTKDGKTKERLVARLLQVPGEAKPSGSGVNPCFLWDNSAYLLGYKKDDTNPERSAECFAAFRVRHLALETTIKDPAFSQVCRFLEKWTPESGAEYKERLDDFAATGFGVFRVCGVESYVHDAPGVRAWWDAQQQEQPTSEPELVAPCLVTGKEAAIAKLHDPPIKGVRDAQQGGAKLVSFNCDAFTSYGKDQSFNAPVSKPVAFQYTNALNALLGGPQSNRHRLQIADATTVFWTATPTVTESLFAAFLEEGGAIQKKAASQDEGVQRQVRIFLDLLRSGGGADISHLEKDPRTPFFILGLSPNAARLSIRFWHVSDLRRMIENLRAHYDALRMQRSFENEPEFPPIWMLLRQTAREPKDISPLLAGALMRSILTGPRTPYPQALANAVIARVRADRTVNYLRAAILKAWLKRLSNQNHNPPMSLDTQRTDSGYLLGRLFAALEKTQEEALGEINATIRDRYYSAASATPATVFPRLMRTYQHHLSKAAGEKGVGYKTNRERLIQDIHAPLSRYPAHLNLEAQGLFAIGYYHQRQSFFTRKPEPETAAA